MFAQLCSEEPAGAAPQRQKRRALAGLSTWCECGARAHVSGATDLRSPVDRELGQVLRVRECTACDRKWRTLELREADVLELRRLAYLYRLTCAQLGGDA